MEARTKRSWGDHRSETTTQIKPANRKREKNAKAAAREDFSRIAPSTHLPINSLQPTDGILHSGGRKVTPRNTHIGKGEKKKKIPAPKIFNCRRIETSD